MEKEETNIIDVDSFAFPKEIVKDGEKAIGFTFDANDVNKMQYIDMIINDENYPIDKLPNELQELVILARKKKNNQENSVKQHR